MIMPVKSVAKTSILIHAPAAKVWDALTNPVLIEQYMFGAQVDTDWQVGSPIRFRGVWEGKPYEDKGQILEVVPEKVLTSTYWSPLSGQPDLPAYYKTVQYELTHEGSSTRLTVTQDNNDSEEEVTQAKANWDTALAGIKKLLESEG
jgi:uncharacterized protein YndB with AHSA1/START domain